LRLTYKCCFGGIVSVANRLSAGVVDKGDGKEGIPTFFVLTCDDFHKCFASLQENRLLI